PPVLSTSASVAVSGESANTPDSEAMTRRSPLPSSAAVQTQPARRYAMRAMRTGAAEGGPAPVSPPVTPGSCGAPGSVVVVASDDSGVAVSAALWLVGSPGETVPLVSAVPSERAALCA